MSFRANIQAEFQSQLAAANGDKSKVSPYLRYDYFSANASPAAVQPHHAVPRAILNDNKKAIDAIFAKSGRSPLDPDSAQFAVWLPTTEAGQKAAAAEGRFLSLHNFNDAVHGNLNIAAEKQISSLLLDFERTGDADAFGRRFDNFVETMKSGVSADDPKKLFLFANKADFWLKAAAEADPEFEVSARYGRPTNSIRVTKACVLHSTLPSRPTRTPTHFCEICEIRLLASRTASVP